ncbi:hypothetical protein PIB30_030081 [Stylosanthes scabra]|uniref:Uncharacterized protein n=1 Tax=Stylosanthes scabra TaxID=79078 RepID=A0ABU6WB72_9FABA|nr:hypothetical protein [Stylosanthes scabra]
MGRLAALGRRGDVREVSYGLGPCEPNIQNSCPRSRKVGESDLFEFCWFRVLVTTFRTLFAHLLKLIGRCAISEKFLEDGGEMADIQGNDPRGVVSEVEGAQMPHELDPLYSWVNRDVLGSPSTMTEDYLTELKSSGVICGGGEEERLYRVEVPRRGERVCGLNLEHPRVPYWLWVNEVMFTEFCVRIPFTPFQQRFLQRCFVAPS